MEEFVMNKFLIFAIVTVVVVLGIAFKMNADSRARAEALAQQIEQQKQDQARYEVEKQAKAEAEKQQALLAVQDEKNAELDEIKRIEDMVKEQLIDPTSATFKNQKGICGEVNAKNKFGGYTGFKKYIYFTDSQSVAIEGTEKDIYSPSVMQMFWEKAC